MMKTGNKAYALDTNIIIDLFKGNKSIADKIDQAKNIYLPVPALGELYLGAENSDRKQHHLQQINMLLKLVQVLNTSEQTAEVYGSIKTHLKRQGKPIPENDIWIAALAKEHNLPVVTRDNHFKHIPDLKIIEW
jgi:tRNA(fMet)-specific endonuclease VapC